MRIENVAELTVPSSTIPLLLDSHLQSNYHNKHFFQVVNLILNGN